MSGRIAARRLKAYKANASLIAITGGVGGVVDEVTDFRVTIVEFFCCGLVVHRLPAG